ncbi:MAG: hypothetical protein WCK54_20610, partial [Desulfuromonadales bacterium]
LILVVPRDGIEPPTRGFSKLTGDFDDPIYRPLQRQLPFEISQLQLIAVLFDSHILCIFP